MKTIDKLAAELATRLCMALDRKDASAAEVQYYAVVILSAAIRHIVNMGAVDGKVDELWSVTMDIVRDIDAVLMTTPSVEYPVSPKPEA